MPVVPVLVVGCIEEVLRDSFAAGVLVEVPQTLTLRYDFRFSAGTFGEGLMRRVVAGLTVLEDAAVPLEPGCRSCALCADVVATLRRAVDRAAPAAVVLGLPAGVDPAVVAHAVGEDLPQVVQVAAVVATFEAAAVEADLLGTDLLLERGLADEVDRRSVGEALVRQIETADVLCAAGPLPARAAVLLDHLVGAGPLRVGLHEADATRLLCRRRPANAVFGTDSSTVTPTGAACAHGVWTLDLRSRRPFHPGRLLAEVERLGTGPVRGRGYFWLPTRPGTRCAWDGAGGQLSIGALGHWDRRPETRLVITGTEREPSDLAAAFAAALATEAEMVAPPDAWAEPDGFDDWLGSRDGCR